MVQQFRNRLELAAKAWQTARDTARQDLIASLRTNINRLGELGYAGALNLGYLQGSADPYAQCYYLKGGRLLGDFTPAYGGQGRPVLSPDYIPFEHPHFYLDHALLEIVEGAEHALRLLGQLPHEYDSDWEF